MGNRLPFRYIVARLSLRWRLTLVSFGLLAVLLTALGVTLSFTEEQTLLQAQARSFSEDTYLALLSLQEFSIRKQDNTQVLALYPQGKGDMKLSVTKLTAVVGKLTGGTLAASVRDLDGKIIIPDDSPLIAPLETLSTSFIKQVLTTNAPYVTVNDIKGQRQLLLVLPIFDPNTNALFGLLVMHTPTTLTDQAVSSMRLILFIGITATLLVAALLTLPLINIGLRPLVEMERASKRIARGALSLRLIVPPTRDEIGRLAHSFNEMVARLEAAFGRQKQFVADVSHELRTPLTALGGSLEMLLLGADGGDPEAARRLLRGMYAEVERMQRLVSDLLALTRLDEGQFRLHDERVDVFALVSEVGAQARQLAQGQEVRCYLPHGLPLIRGDGDQLRRVLLNILENALKFTPPPGKVEILVDSAGPDAVTIKVLDTGVGISAEALPHVFDRFYRADPSRTRAAQEIGGSGLGLSIAQGLIEAHGGSIRIASRPGAGTRVTIWLPAHTDLVP